MKINKTSKAFKCGMIAYSSLLNYHANPYKSGTRSWHEWRAGMSKQNNDFIRQLFV